MSFFSFSLQDKNQLLREVPSARPYWPTIGKIPNFHNCQSSAPCVRGSFVYKKRDSKIGAHTTNSLLLPVKHTKASKAYKMPSVKFVIVTLSLLAVMLVMTVQSRHLVPFKKNLDQVLKEWNCKGPQSQLVYLGNFY